MPTVEKTSVTQTFSWSNHPDGDKSHPRQLGRLIDFEKHVEHLARIESTLIVDMGLTKEDAQLFISTGSNAVFGRAPINYTAFSGEEMVETPEGKNGVWMNELREDYNEKTFDLKITRTVYVTFEGFHIRVRRPNRRSVPREALYNEKVNKDFTWAEDRVYDTRNADVFLLPLEVPVKIRWLHRFPIAIKLKPAAAHGGQLVVESTEQDAKFVAKDPNTLFFFSRSDRAKEETFWHFVSASGKVPFPFKIPPIGPTPDMTPLNALVTRIGAETLVDPLWKQIIQEKVAQKIGQIKKPYYLDEIRLTEMDMGTSLPKLGPVSDKVKCDRLGTWFTMDMELVGPIRSVIATNVNLMKFNHPEEAKAEAYKKDGEISENLEERKRLHYDTLSSLYGGYEDLDGDLEEDSEIPEAAKPKAMKWFESIAESKLFKYISDISFVKKKMEEVSNKDITVYADIKTIKGRLAINIPPPPSDRIWYGFLPGTELDIDVTLYVGDTKMEFDLLSEFIDKNMRKMFEQTITVPNMDDVVVFFANSGIDPDNYRLEKLRQLILYWQ